MNKNGFERIWQSMSAELLDTAVRIGAFRRWALKKGEQELYRKYVELNEDRLPARMQEMRCRVLVNLLHAVERALADGRISAQVRRAVLRNFIGRMVLGERERQRPFREEHGYDPPTFLTISPTRRCNLHCLGCYAGSSARDGNTLPYGTFSRILADKKREWGSYFTVISGGEPLVYSSEGKTLFDVLGEHPDQYFLIYTNGTLIDRQAARRMAELGNVTPAISVEGWAAETDARRGDGVFARVLQAMAALREFGVPFGISATATRENAELILSDELMEFYFHEQGAIYGWIFQYMPIGRGFTVDLMITPDQRQWMLEKELKLVFEKDLFLVDFWNGGPMSLGCISAGRPGGYFYIDWNGNIAPCVFFPYHVANIDEIYGAGGSLSSALRNDYFAKIRAWQAEYLRGDGSRGERVGNLFMPCPMRDHYEFAYRTILESGARPADENAALAIQDDEYRRRMREYNRDVTGLLDPRWETEMYPAAEKRGARPGH